MERKRLTQSSTDRISGLLVEIIHEHILPSLPNKDVKVLSSVSKTWYHIVTSYPYFDFDVSCFGGQDNIDRYTNYATQTLQRFLDHNSELNSNYLQIVRKLKIPITFHPDVVPLLDYWIKLAFQRGVEEFHLQIKNTDEEYYDTPSYDLPPSVFAARSIKVAFIIRCSMLPSFPSGYVRGSCPNLKKLFLMKVVLDDLTLKAIISSCPLLVELSLNYCMGNMKRLRICNLLKLKDLRFYKWKGEGYPTIEIDAPNLEFLMLQGCPKLTDNLWLDYNVYLQYIVSRLPSLRKLMLCGMSGLTKLKVSSHILNKLIIFSCKNLVELEIDAPNVLSVVYHGNLTPLASSKHNVSRGCVWDVFISCDCVVNPLITDEDFLVELSNFFHKIKHGNLCLYFEEIKRFSFKALNQRNVQPVSNIDGLELFIYHYENIDYDDLLDGVLWSCHPRTLSLELYGFASEEIIGYDVLHNYYVAKLICGIIVGHRKYCCSCTFGRSSWLHRLENVTYVTKDGTEGQLPLDGTSVPDFHSSYDKIKFIFKK